LLDILIIPKENANDGNSLRNQAELLAPPLVD